MATVVVAQQLLPHDNISITTANNKAPPIILLTKQNVRIISDPEIDLLPHFDISHQQQQHPPPSNVPCGVAGAITSMYQGRPGPTSFMGQSEPSLSLEQYSARLLKYMDQWSTPIHGPNAGTGIRTLSMSIELLHRLHDNGFGICPRTAHRLLLVAVLVSAKSTEDFVIPNKYWSKVGGVPLSELNELEIAFCKFLSWRLTIDAEDVAVHREKLIGPEF